MMSLNNNKVNKVFDLLVYGNNLTDQQLKIQMAHVNLQKEVEIRQTRKQILDT